MLVSRFILAASLLVACSACFAPCPQQPRRVSFVALGMGKGLNKARSKAAELARKMELAKKQKGGDDDEDASTEKSLDKLSDAEIKEKNDHLRFEQLLQQESSNVLNAYAKDGYLSKEQEEEEIDAARSGVDRLFEGDPAPSEPFEGLVSIKSESVLGAGGASRLVPWLRSKRPNEYLIIVCDPRQKSSELRTTIKTLASDLPVDLKKHLIVINADSPRENRRWMKKNGMWERMEIYSDQELDWMRAYTALGQKRFSMSMFIVANERIQKLARELDGVVASRVIQNAVKSLRS